MKTTPADCFHPKMSHIVEKYPQQNTVLLQAELNIMKGNKYNAVMILWQKGYLNLKPSVTLDLDEKMLHNGKGHYFSWNLSGLLCCIHNSTCPASPEKEDQRAAGSPAALTQLDLCLRLAPDLKGRKLATRCNPQ